MNSQSALLVIDVQNGFINEHSRHVVPIIRELVQQWTKTSHTALFTRYHNYEGSPYQRLIGWNKLRNAPRTDLAPNSNRTPRQRRRGYSTRGPTRPRPTKVANYWPDTPT